MDPRTFVRTGAGTLAGLALACAMAACGQSGGGGGTPTGPGGGPTLARIVPDTGGVSKTDKTVSVVLKGTGFDADNLQVKVSGSGVAVTNVSILNATYVNADFVIAGGTPVGDRQVSVTTDAGSSGRVTFTVAHVPHVIELVDDAVEPANLVVEAGDVVEWKNVGFHDHTVSVYGDFEWEDVPLKSKETFRHVFDTPGDYAFICIYHNEVSNVSVQ